MRFEHASTVAEALDAIARGSRPIAGGSDLVVAARQGKAPLPDALVAIDRVAELDGVRESADGGLSIGAITAHAELERHPAIVARFTALADGAALVGSPATRHVGTIGGNVMNASPAMDTGAPLVVLAASVELVSRGGTRVLPVEALWHGPGRTTAAPDELCAQILLPPPGAGSGSAYLRLEYRRAMEIAVVGAAASVRLDDSGALTDLAVALTAVAPTIRSVDVAALIGHPVDDALLNAVAAAASAAATPISDLRASEGYRRHTVGVMARRAVQIAAERAVGQHVGVPANRHWGIGAAS